MTGWFCLISPSHAETNTERLQATRLFTSPIVANPQLSQLGCLFRETVPFEVGYLFRPEKKKMKRAKRWLVGYNPDLTLYFNTHAL